MDIVGSIIGGNTHMTINLQTIATEHRNENTMNLDQMSSLEIITEMNREMR